MRWNLTCKSKQQRVEKRGCWLDKQRERGEFYGEGKGGGWRKGCERRRRWRMEGGVRRRRTVRTRSHTGRCGRSRRSPKRCRFRWQKRSGIGGVGECCWVWRGKEGLKGQRCRRGKLESARWWLGSTLAALNILLISIPIFDEEGLVFEPFWCEIQQIWRRWNLPRSTGWHEWEKRTKFYMDDDDVACC